MAPRKKSLTSKLNEAAGNSGQTVEMRETSSFMPFEKIKDRVEDTRKLNQKHVKSLELSIMAIGLIEPLVVDQDGVLLAGGHRKAAIAQIADSPTGDKLIAKLFPGGVPVRVMPFSASDSPQKALQVEVAENEHRRDYTRSEVLAIAERLKQAGFEELKGRPKKGQKALIPALTAVVGKSRRQVFRLLEEPKEERVTPDTLSNTDQRDRHLKAAIAALEKWQGVGGKGRKRRETELSKYIPDILDRLKKALE